jgi:hypothetical protein
MQSKFGLSKIKPTIERNQKIILDFKFTYKNKEMD